MYLNLYLDNRHNLAKTQTEEKIDRMIIKYLHIRSVYRAIIYRQKINKHIKMSMPELIKNKYGNGKNKNLSYYTQNTFMDIVSKF